MVLSDLLARAGFTMQVADKVQPVSGARIAVYSCYFGAHEPFNPEATGSDNPAYDRFVFTDHASLPTTARLVTLKDRGEGPAILSRLLTKCEATGNAKALAALTQISPAAWRHILLNGHYTFQSDGKVIDLDALVAGVELA